jgi:hypothetical protein
MNAAKTNDTRKSKGRNYPPGWSNLPPIANGELPGQGEVTIGCYRAADGETRLVPVLTCYRVHPDTGKRERLDQVLVGPVYRPGDPGFDLLSRAFSGVTLLPSDEAEPPCLPTGADHWTELVLVVGPSKETPEWVVVGVWDGRRVHLVGCSYRDEGDNVCRWLWQSNLPHVTAYASPEDVSEELDWAWPLPWPHPWPAKRG